MKTTYFFSMVVCLVLVLSAFVPVRALQDGNYPEVPAAAIDIDRHGGRSAIESVIPVTISICNTSVRCPLSESKVLRFNVYPADTGSTLLATADNSPDFADFVSYLTDGVDGYIKIQVFGLFIGKRESSFLGFEAGTNVVDLAGHNINLIGLHVDSAVLDVPGTDPNGDGNWSDFTLQGSLMFLEPITSKDACKDGYQDLFTFDGGVFKNQGDCIQYFLTGF